MNEKKSIINERKWKLMNVGKSSNSAWRDKYNIRRSSNSVWKDKYNIRRSSNSVWRSSDITLAGYYLAKNGKVDIKIKTI